MAGCSADRSAGNSVLDLETRFFSNRVPCRFDHPGDGCPGSRVNRSLFVDESPIDAVEGEWLRLASFWWSYWQQHWPTRASRPSLFSPTVCGMRARIFCLRFIFIFRLLLLSIGLVFVSERWAIPASVLVGRSFPGYFFSV